MSDDKVVADLYDLENISQDEITSAGISAVNKLLVEKGILTKEEMQGKFLEILRNRGFEVKQKEGDR